MAVSDCRNEVVPWALTASLRRQVIAGLRRLDGPVVSPAVALLALFSERLDPWLETRLQALYSERVASAHRLRRGRRSGGFVYVFRDDRDEPDVYKIGATQQRSPERRLAQWRRALNDTAGEHVFLQFYTATLDPFLAEAVLHTLLYCRQLSARINRVTGTRADEYFYVRNLAALRHLSQAVCRHVDAFVAAAAAAPAAVQQEQSSRSDCE